MLANQTRINLVSRAEISSSSLPAFSLISLLETHASFFFVFFLLHCIANCMNVIIVARRKKVKKGKKERDKEEKTEILFFYGIDSEQKQEL
jgi:hypothetical protein